MPILKYSDLDIEQKMFITNGCGGKGGYINPPNFIFKASCNHHDFKFWVGHTWKHLLKANSEFYRWMRRDIKDADIRWYKRAYYHTWAFSYYTAVNIGGAKYFYFSDAPKTLEDLQKEMSDAKET